MKNILLADDHAIVRSGLKGLIRDNICNYKIDEAKNETEIMNAVKGCKYDLIILDIIMDNTDFVKLMDWLRATLREPNILIFTIHPENIYGLRSLKLGAHGYLHKTASDEEIVLAIKTMLEGKRYINAALIELLSQSFGSKQNENPFQSLSFREMEIALLLHNGKPLPEICTILNIQYSTANTYKRRIFEKLNVDNVIGLSHLMQAFNITA